MTDSLHVRISGDLVGGYVVEEQLTGGHIVLVPEPDYPAVFPLGGQRSVAGSTS